MDEHTIEFILKDTQIDKVSGVPFSAVVFMLYYGLELKHFLLELSDEFIQRFPLQQYQAGEYASVYLSGSAAQGLYLNTMYLPNARDIDIVTINKKYPVREKCEYEENAVEDLLIKFSDNLYTADECQNVYKSNATTAECDDRYLNIKVLPETPVGYVLLQKCRCHPLPVQTVDDLFVSSLKTTEARVQFWHELKQFIRQTFPDIEKDSSLFAFFQSHGPAATAYMSSFESTTPFEIDMVFCLPYPRRKDSTTNELISWPSIADEWLTRERPSDWPSRTLIEEIKQDGCTLIPKGSTGSSMEDFEWRISFTGDLKLARNLSRVQRELMHIIKATISEPDRGSIVLDLVTDIESFQFLNLLYQESEHINQKFWIPENIAKMLFHLLDKYLEYFQQGHLNHYFIKTRNIFEKFKSLSEEETDTLVYTILRLRHDSLGQLLQQEKYLRLPQLAHQMVYSPFVEQVKSSQTVTSGLYVNTLVRLVKAHLMEEFYLTANIYANDALDFYYIMEKDTLTDDEFLDLMLVLVISSHRIGLRAQTLEYLEKLHLIMNKKLPQSLINLFGGSTYVHLLGIYARTLLASLDETTNIPRNDVTSLALRMYRDARKAEPSNLSVTLDMMSICLYLDNIEELNILLKETLSSNPHLVSFPVEHSEGDSVPDSTSESSIDDIYDRSTFINEENSRTEEIDSQHCEQTEFETSFYATSFEQTNLETRFDDEASGRLDFTSFLETHFDKNGYDSFLSSTFENDFDKEEDVISVSSSENQEQTRLEKSDFQTSFVDETSFTTREFETPVKTIVKEQEKENKILDHAEMSDPAIDVLYDRTKYKRDSEEENIPFTLEDVRMIDAELFTDYCRLKAFQRLKIDVKAKSVAERVNRKILAATHVGKKVSLQMLETAYEMFYPDKPNPDPTVYFDDFLSKDLEYVVYSTADIPLLDEVVVNSFSYIDSNVIKIPTDIYFLHLQMRYHKTTGDLNAASKLLEQMEKVTDQLPDGDDISFCKYLIGCHHELLGNTNASRKLFQESRNKSKPKPVKDQVLDWLEQVFDLVVKFEPKNKYLDDIFAV